MAAASEEVACSEEAFFNAVVIQQGVVNAPAHALKVVEEGIHAGGVSVTSTEKALRSGAVSEPAPLCDEGGGCPIFLRGQGQAVIPVKGIKG